MTCMAYFPVIIKASHLKDLRDYIGSKFGSFDGGFSAFSYSWGHYSQFNIMCAYFFWHKRAEYKWYIHDRTPSWNGRDNVAWGQFGDKSVIFTPDMYQHWPFLAAHLDGRYVTRRHINETMIWFIINAMCWKQPNSSFVLAKDLSLVSQSALKGIQSKTCNTNEEFFPEMHKFEDADFNSENAMPNRTAAIQIHRQRNERLKFCIHSYLFV